VDATSRSFGGWSLLAAAAGVLAGTFAFQLLFPRWVYPVVPGIGGVVALVASVAGFALLSPAAPSDGSSWIGWRVVGVAVLYGALSASVFRQPGRRDLATWMWSLATAALLVAELFLIDDAGWRLLVIGLTGVALALLGPVLEEPRLWLAGGIVVSLASACVLAVLTPPTHFVIASANPGSGLWVAAACVVGGSILRATSPVPYRRWIDPIVAVGALYVLSLGILELAERAFGGSVDADFQRGHVAVSMVWALIGLALLVAGLVRNSSLLRIGGVALFGLSLGKIFLYDLSALNAAARALSFIVVGGLVLVGGFFVQRLQMGPRNP
jgi:uncharacterized membrane protein